MGTQIQNYDTQIQNMKQIIWNQIQNLEFKLQIIVIQNLNIGMKISNQNQNMNFINNNMMRQNQFMGMLLFNIFNKNNDDWINLNGNNNNLEKKIHFGFKTIKGEKLNLFYNENINIEELFKLFIKRII